MRIICGYHVTGNAQALQLTDADFARVYIFIEVRPPHAIEKLFHVVGGNMVKHWCLALGAPSKSFDGTREAVHRSHQTLQSQRCHR